MKYCKVWDIIYDGGSGTWLYRRDLGSGVYAFIELLDMPDACGSDATEAWVCEVSLVDITHASIDTMSSACDCVGMVDPSFSDLGIALFEYGAKATLYSDSGGPVTDSYDHGENSVHFRRLRKEAREFVESELLDETNRECLLDSTIVNKIGQSAREYMQGDLWGALRRLPENHLMRKLYRRATHTLCGEPIPEDI